MPEGIRRFMEKNSNFPELTKNEISMIKRMFKLFSESGTADRSRYFEDAKYFARDFRAALLMENSAKPLILRKTNTRLEKEIEDFTNDLIRLQTDESDLFSEMMVLGPKYLMFKLSMQKAYDRSMVSYERLRRHTDKSPRPNETESDDQKE